MSERARTMVKPVATAKAAQPISARLSPAPQDLLLRKCGCAASASSDGECDECKKKKSSLAEPRFRHSFGQVSVLERSPETVQTKLAVSSPGDRYEREADDAATQAMRLAGKSASLGRTLGSVPVRIQRKAAEEEGSAPAVAAPGFLIDDGAGQLGPGQMRKSDFLAALRARLFAPADASAAAAAQPQNRSYLEGLLDTYGHKQAGDLESAICEYAPDARNATSARDYIPLVSDRLSREGAGGGGGILQSIGGALSGIASGIAGGIGKAFSKVGLFTKAREGGARSEASPQAIQAQLSAGQALQGGVRTRMEAAFGHDFSRVRVHADASAAALSSRLNARAFTVGSQVAFAAGEYQPGTMVGDALIAHELAHVVQQEGAAGRPATMPAEPAKANYDALEQDADSSAVNAMLSSWGRVKLGARVAGGLASSRLRSGLRLQRCPPPKQHEESITHPRQTTEGFDRSPSPGSRYERYVAEATQSLLGKGKPLGSNKSVPGTIGFGLPWGTDNAPWDMDRDTKEAPKCDAKDFESYYDSKYWKLVDENRNCVLESKGNSADAIAAIFDESRSSQWQVDCGLFTQLPHYYALLQLFGHDGFSQQFKTIRLRKEFSTGLRTTEFWFEGSKPHWLVKAKVRDSLGHPATMEDALTHRQVPVQEADQQEVHEDVVLARAPVGSRVNFSITERSVPSVDNTIKMGPDLYAGHGVAEGKSDLYTKAEICERIAKKETSNPQEKVQACHVTVVDIRWDPTREKEKK